MTSLNDLDKPGAAFSHEDGEAMAAWMDVLEVYARDWDKTFDGQPYYFTQEFWYLFVYCMRAAWRGSPLSVSAACQVMKTGSNRTREERINRAVRDGLLEKVKHGEDKRTTVLLPTAQLEERLRGHFRRTLAATRQYLDER